METREFSRNPFKGSILFFVFVEAVFILAGLGLIFYSREFLIHGVAVMVAGSTIGGFFIAMAVLNLKCPDCHQPLKREGGRRTCKRCDIEWKMPGR